MISFPPRSPQSTEFLVLYNRFSLLIYFIHLHAQSHPILCDPVDCSLPGFSAHGIFQARILEWVAISSSRDLPDPATPVSPALADGFFTTEPPGKPILYRSAYLSIPISQLILSPLPSLVSIHSIFLYPVSLVLLCKNVIFLDSTCK